MFFPSTHPHSRNPSKNAEFSAAWTPPPPALRMPTVYLFPPCCARAASGHAATVVSDVEAAARQLGLQVRVFNASTISEIDAAFASLVREGTDALFVGPDAFF